MSLVFTSYYALNRAARQVSESNDRVADAIRANSIEVAASNRQIAASNDRLANTLHDNSVREVAARDRVDITLAEYLKMKEDIATLTSENRRLTDFFLKIGLPIDLPIIPSSIQKYVSDGPFDVFDFSQTFGIRFKCDMSQMHRTQRDMVREEFLR